MTPLDKFASIEVRREDEFSPLKNARGTGQDDPDTSRDDIMKQGQRWLEAAGGIVITDGEATGVEVSPLISYVCSVPSAPFLSFGQAFIWTMLMLICIGRREP